MKNSLKVAIIGAMDCEINTLKECLKEIETIEYGKLIVFKGKIGNNEIFLTKSGVGKVCAAINTQFIIDKFQPDCIINTGVAGGIAGLAASTVTGGVSAAAGISLLTSATASIAHNIISDVNNERNMSQKLAELKAQSASVSTSDDLSLLNFYNGNKMHRFDYKPSTKVENSIYDLFYRTGYAFNSTGVPDRQSRRAFNYVQCEPIFRDENNSDWTMYVDDVKSRFKAGVTYMHRFQTEENGDYIYDFNFNYENWETFICPRNY